MVLFLALITVALARGVCGDYMWTVSDVELCKFTAAGAGPDRCPYPAAGTPLVRFSLTLSNSGSESVSIDDGDAYQEINATFHPALQLAYQFKNTVEELPASEPYICLYDEQCSAPSFEVTGCGAAAEPGSQGLSGGCSLTVADECAWAVLTNDGGLATTPLIYIDRGNATGDAVLFKQPETNLASIPVCAADNSMTPTEPPEEEGSSGGAAAVSIISAMMFCIYYCLCVCCIFTAGKRRGESEQQERGQVSYWAQPQPMAYVPPPYSSERARLRTVF